VAIIAAISGWRLLIRWYSHVDVAIAESFEPEFVDGGSARRLKESSAQWDLSLVEFRLPGDSVYSGKTVADLALRTHADVSIIGIERQGFQLSTVGPTTHLFSGDLLYLLGESDSLQKAHELLAVAAPDTRERTNLAGSILDQVAVLENAVCAGRTLGELQWPKFYGVQVAAILRGGERRLSPDPDHRIEPGEILLLAGTQAAINEVRRAINPSH
jgi:K+/H+ antiporter YhaU regulatory subunit KhtT